MSKTCDWCGKETKASLHFLTPKEWIKHKTPDGIQMLFCSVRCFQAFTCTKSGEEVPTKKEQHEVLEEPVTVTPMQT